MPRDVRVRLCTVNGGTVTVSGVTGDFDVSNVNGKVVLTGLGGSGSATTVNGDIDALVHRGAARRIAVQDGERHHRGDVPAQPVRRPAA